MTAAALASRSSGVRTESDGGTYSDSASAASTPSPGHRNFSLSPTSEMPPMPPLSRQTSELSYVSGPFPQHLRGELPPPSTRSSPSLPSPTRSSFSTQHRPSLTSHPATYGPPPTLEPPTHQDSRRPGSASGKPSPQQPRVAISNTSKHELTRSWRPIPVSRATVRWASAPLLLPKLTFTAAA